MNSGVFSRTCLAGGRFQDGIGGSSFADWAAAARGKLSTIGSGRMVGCGLYLKVCLVGTGGGGDGVVDARASVDVAPFSWGGGGVEELPAGDSVSCEGGGRVDGLAAVGTSSCIFSVMAWDSSGISCR